MIIPLTIILLCFGVFLFNLVLNNNIGPSITGFSVYENNTLLEYTFKSVLNPNNYKNIQDVKSGHRSMRKGRKESFGRNYRKKRNDSEGRNFRRGKKPNFKKRKPNSEGKKRNFKR